MDYKVYWLLDKLEIQKYEDGEKVSGQVYQTDVDRKTDEGYIFHPFDTEEFGEFHVEEEIEHIRGNWSNGQGSLCSSTIAKLKDDSDEVVATNKYNTCLLEETPCTMEGLDLTSCPITGEWRKNKTCNFNQPLEITEEFEGYIEDSQ